jgi:hypothetical protein
VNLGLNDWNTLAGTQLKTQVGFCCAACGFDYQGGVGMAQAPHVEGYLGFACDG